MGESKHLTIQGKDRKLVVVSRAERLLAAVQLGTIGDLEMTISASSFMVGLLHTLSLCSGHAVLVLEGRSPSGWCRATLQQQQ
jgi:hypothetical protein